DQLNLARDLGLERLETIAQNGATSLNLPLEMVRTYLRENLHFTLGSAERMGLRLFQDLASAHGLAHSHPLRFRTARREEAFHRADLPPLREPASLTMR